MHSAAYSHHYEYLPEDDRDDILPTFTLERPILPKPNGFSPISPHHPSIATALKSPPQPSLQRQRSVGAFGTSRDLPRSIGYPGDAALGARRMNKLSSPPSSQGGVARKRFEEDRDHFHSPPSKKPRLTSPVSGRAYPPGTGGMLIDAGTPPIDDVVPITDQELSAALDDVQEAQERGHNVPNNDTTLVSRVVKHSSQRIFAMNQPLTRPRMMASVDPDLHGLGVGYGMYSSLHYLCDTLKPSLNYWVNFNFPFSQSYIYSPAFNPNFSSNHFSFQFLVMCIHLPPPEIAFHPP